MTVIQSASRYAYTPAFRGRPSISYDAAEFSPNRLDQIDPDGGNAGNAVKPQITRQREEGMDSRFEFTLPYRSAFFHTSSEDDGNGTRRDDSRDGRQDDAGTQTGQANTYADDSPESPANAASDTLSENPIDLLASLLGGISNA